MYPPMYMPANVRARQCKYMCPPMHVPAIHVPASICARQRMYVPAYVPANVCARQCMCRQCTCPPTYVPHRAQVSYRVGCRPSKTKTKTPSGVLIRTSFEPDPLDCGLCPGRPTHSTTSRLLNQAGSVRQPKSHGPTRVSRQQGLAMGRICGPPATGPPDRQRPTARQRSLPATPARQVPVRRPN